MIISNIHTHIRCTTYKPDTYKYTSNKIVFIYFHISYTGQHEKSCMHLILGWAA